MATLQVLQWMVDLASTLPEEVDKGSGSFVIFYILISYDYIPADQNK